MVQSGITELQNIKLCDYYATKLTYQRESRFSKHQVVPPADSVSISYQCLLSKEGAFYRQALLMARQVKHSSKQQTWEEWKVVDITQSLLIFRLYLLIPFMTKSPSGTFVAWVYSSDPAPLIQG